MYVATQSDAACPVARTASWRPPYPSAPRGVSMAAATLTKFLAEDRRNAHRHDESRYHGS